MGRAKLALILTFTVLASCDDGQLENELNQSRVALAEERASRATAEDRANQAEALVAEMQARGYPLAEFTLTVSIRTRVLGDPLIRDVRRLATVARLELSDGQVWELIDLDSGTSLTRAGNDGTYNLQFAYQPEDARSVLGRDVSEVSRIRALRLRYGAILNSLNLDPAYELASLTVTANGLPVVEVMGLAEASMTDSSGFEVYEVASHFEAANERYIQALSERARTRFVQPQ